MKGEFKWKKILFTALVALLLGVNCVTASALEKSENISKEDEEIMEYITSIIWYKNGELYSNDYDISNHMYATQKDVRIIIDIYVGTFLIIMLEHHLAIVSILIQANGSQEMELFH